VQRVGVGLVRIVYVDWRIGSIEAGGFAAHANGGVTVGGLEREISEELYRGHGG